MNNMTRAETKRLRGALGTPKQLMRSHKEPDLIDIHLDEEEYHQEESQAFNNNHRSLYSPTDSSGFSDFTVTK